MLISIEKENKNNNKVAQLLCGKTVYSLENNVVNGQSKSPKYCYFILTTVYVNRNLQTFIIFFTVNCFQNSFSKS